MSVSKEYLRIKDPAELGCGWLKAEPGAGVKLEPGAKKKRSPASLSIVCPVCGGPAPDHVHFGGQCCYSCRAFFRRTSVKPVASFRCRSGRNDCVISSGIKSCIPCRLQKCLQVGMDPSLVKGKKFKKEEALLSPSTSADCHDSDPERNYKLEAEEEASTSPPPLLRNIRVQDEAAAGQEALLHHRAKVLKYQGMYLQFQARLLEREAHAHYSHIKAEPGLGLGAGNDTHHFYVAADGLDTRAPAPPPPPQYEPGYGGEEETETPLDLSLQKPASPANYLHTQAENMPRIFFSLSNAPIPSATKQN